MLFSTPSLLILPLLYLSSQTTLITATTTPPKIIHHTLTRRSGPFTPTIFASVNANLTYLNLELRRTEARFNLTKREVKGNRLVRKPRAASHGDVSDGGGEGGELMGKVAEEGVWYAMIKIGNPPQEIEVDLNMLGADFWVRATTGKGGRKYDDFFSESCVKNEKHPFPSCTLPTDLFHLPTINQTVPLEFAYCRPRKASQMTLGPSGSMLGLAPSEHLSQTGRGTIMKQLVEKDIITRPMYSITLIGKEHGVLSMGGTIAEQVDAVLEETRKNLDAVGGSIGQSKEEDGEGKVMKGEVESGETSGEAELVKRGKEDIEKVKDRAKDWAWSKTQVAEGWWQILMSSVWVDGMKVLSNQAVVIDLNTPFILAPPLAAKEFYASISGAFQLPHPNSSFYAFPCLNPPRIDFEFGGSRFAFMRSARGQFGDWKGELPGGRFSLGRLKDGSGYCVGNVIATRMGLKDESDGIIDGNKRAKVTAGETGGLGGNGMRDVWVIGEGFFRGMGLAFDLKDRQVGFRSY